MASFKLVLCLMAVSCLTWADIQIPENFHADFTQMITSTKGKVITYSGEVYFADKKLFKWSYLKPTKKEVCTDGKELLVVDHDLEQVSVFYIEKGLDIVKILGQAKHYKDHIYLAQFKDKQYTVQLNAKEELQSVAYFDNLDNKVQILFTQMKYTKGTISKKIIQCNYPVDYDVIRG